MLIVQIDVVYAEPLQGCVAGLANVLGTSVNLLFRADPLADDPELGGEHDAVTAPLEGLAYLKLRHAVHVRGVDEVHLQIEGSMNQRDGGIVVAYAAGVHLCYANAHGA